MFYKLHMRDEKLDRIWEPYFRIVEPTGPVTFIIWDQISGRVFKKVHAGDLKLAEVDDWESPKQQGTEKRRRKATLVEPEDIDTESVTEDEEGETQLSGLAIRRTPEMRKSFNKGLKKTQRN